MTHSREQFAFLNMCVFKTLIGLFVLSFDAVNIIQIVIIIREKF